MTRVARNRHLLLEDIRAARNPAALLRIFSLLGYQVEPDAVPLSSEEIGFAPADAAAIKNLYLLADQAGGLQVILFELEAVALSRLRSLVANFLARGGHYLLVATSDYRTRINRMSCCTRLVKSPRFVVILSEQELNDRVYRLFILTRDEIKLIEEKVGHGSR